MRTKFQNSKYTIGILINQIEGEYQNPILKGITDAAKEKNVNTLFFVGGTVGNFFEGDEGNNLCYELAKTNIIDGLIICAGSIGGYVDKKTLNEYFSDYKNIPKVSISIDLDDSFTISIDNKNSMKEIINHLVDYHGYKNIVFVSGPLTNHEAIERLEGYIEAIKSHSIEYKPEFVINGDFTYESGLKAAKIIEERKLEFDAIVCANDGMAMGVYDGLKKRGLLAPNDYALTGFDDYISSSIFSVPLTTVKQPLYEQGKQSLNILLELIEGKKIEKKIFLPTRFVIRDSCGCFLTNYVKEKKQDFQKLKDENYNLINLLMLKKDDIIEFLVKKFGLDHILLREYKVHLNGLIDSLISDIEKKKAKGLFVLVLNDILSKRVDDYEFLKKWYDIIDELNLILRNFQSSKEDLLIIERIFNESNKLINFYFLRFENSKLVALHEYIWLLRMFICHLDYEFDIEKIKDIIFNELSSVFGINSLFLCLFKEYNNEIPEKSILALAFDERGKIEKKDIFFNTKELIPEYFLIESKRYNLLFFVLFTRLANFGYMAIEINDKIPFFIYPTLRERISSALQSSTIFNQKERAKEELKLAVLKSKQNEEKYKDMIEMLPVGIIETDERFNILNMNKKTAEILHQKEEKEINFRDLILEQEKFDEYIRLSIKNSEADFVDFTIIDFLGNTISILAKVNFVYYDKNSFGYRWVIIEEASFLKLSIIPGEKFYEKYNITKREKEVIEKILQGDSIIDVSEKLHITIGTVKDHLSSVYKKTKVKNKRELIQKIKKEKSLT